MAAERRRSARRDRAHDALLGPSHMSDVIAKIGLAVATQDIREFDCLRSKEAPARATASAGAPVYPGGITSNDNRSSGLCVARIVWVATCV
jgi:hypothetical protein